MSVLVNGPELPLFSVDRLRQFRGDGKIQIGLHLDLLEFDPVSQDVAKSLFKFEKFWKKGLPQWSRAGRYLFYVLRPQYLQHEIEAQVCHFKTLFRQTPDYVDSHFHVHQWPFIFSKFLFTLQKQNFQQELFVRNSSYPLKSIASKVFRFPWLLTLKVASLALIGQFRKGFLRKMGIKTNDKFLGVNPFSPHVPYESVFSYYQNDLGSNGIWMIHPAEVREPSDGIGAFRFEEYVFFRNRGLAQDHDPQPSI